MRRVSGFEQKGVEFLVLSEEHPRALDALSKVERQVAIAALAGFSDLEIATQRSCSRRTVENHLRSIYRKLSVSSRFQLATLAYGSDASLKRDEQ